MAHGFANEGVVVSCAMFSTSLLTPLHDLPPAPYPPLQSPPGRTRETQGQAPEQRSPEGVGGFGRRAEQSPFTSYEAQHDHCSSHSWRHSREAHFKKDKFLLVPSSTSQSWEKRDESLVSSLLTQERDQVMSPRESLTLQEKALCTKQPEYGDTWCVKKRTAGVG